MVPAVMENTMAKKPTLSPEDARREALQTALATIERRFGQGAVMRLSDDVHVQVPVIPTGCGGMPHSSLRVSSRLSQ